MQYSVGQPLVVSCIDTEGCTRDLLEAVGGDLGELTSYYRSEPFKYGSVSSDNYSYPSTTIIIPHDHGGSFFRRCCSC